MKENSKKQKNEKLLMPKTGKLLMKFSVKEQFEISLISLVGLIVISLLTAIYMVFFMEFSLIFKILLGLNALFGMSFLASFLMTTYQQYLNFVNISSAMQDMGNLADMVSNISGLSEQELKGGISDK